ASGRPVVAAPEPALREVADGAAVYAEDGDFAAATRRALDDRDSLAAAGIERARLFSWAETARRTVEVYRQGLGGGVRRSWSPPGTLPSCASRCLRSRRRSTSCS